MRDQSRVYYATHKEERRQYNKLPHVIAARKRYYEKNKPAIMDKHAANSRRRYHTNPVSRAKSIARQAVAKALKNGTLVRPAACEHCYKHVKLEAHHANGYDTPHWLDVTWLCRKCHRKANAAQGVVEPIAAPDFAAILETYGHACAYCGVPFTSRKRPELDHVVPLSKGGEHVAENIVPACVPCNRAKNRVQLRKPLPGRPVSVKQLKREARGHWTTRVFTCVVCHEQKLGECFRQSSRFGVRTECLECEETVQRCSTCKELKPVDQYGNDPAMANGRRSQCIACTATHQATVRRSDEARAKRRVYRQRPEVQAKEREYMRTYQPSQCVVVFEKRCSCCEQVKPAVAFGPHKLTRDRLRSWCRECMAGKMRERRIHLAAV